MHTLRQLNYAISVWREGSFVRAAEKLNISQPAISGQVRQLEEDLGFKLFERTPKGARATTFGTRILLEAEKVQTASLNLAETVAQMRGGAGGAFAVGIVSGIADNILPALVPAIETFSPKVRLEMVTTTTRRIYRLLLEDRLEIGFTVGADERMLPKDLKSEIIARTELAVIIPSSHRMSRKTSVDLKTLAREPLVMSELSIGYGEVILSLFERRQLRPILTTISDNVETAESLVRAGRGIAIVPRKSAELSKAQKQIKVLTLAPPEFVEYSLVSLDKRLSGSRQKRLDAILGGFDSKYL